VEIREIPLSDSSHNAFLFAQAFLRFARWRAARTALLILVGALFEGVGLLLLVPVLDFAMGPGAPPSGHMARVILSPLRAYGETERLLILLGVFALLLAARCLVHNARDRSLNALQLEFADSIRSGIIEKLTEAPWQKVARAQHARVVQTLSMEINQLGFAAYSALTAVVALAMLASYCVLALLLSPLAGALAIVFALVGALASRPYLRRAHALGRTMTEAHFGQTDKAMRFLNGLKLAIAQGLQREFAREYRSVSAAAMQDRLTFLRYQSNLRNSTTTLTGIVGGATLLAGIGWFHPPLPVLITLLVTLSRMSAPAQALQQGAQNMLHNLPSYRAILSLEAGLEAAPAATAHPAQPPKDRSDAAIVFEHVTFRYDGPEGQAGIENLDLRIPTGAFVGIAGPSAAGKTTFLDLVAGILIPQAGAIAVHGHSPCRAGSTPHRAGLAYVAQDPFLFDDTIRRNLAWSQAEASAADMRQALALVGAEGLVARLDEGLDTRIGERGTLISAGERQRLALARALLRRPTLLILDEATNAIDVASERAVLASLASLKPHVTVLMVAHRQESLDLCDHILRFPGPTLSRVDGGPQRQNVQPTPPVSTVLL